MHHHHVNALRTANRVYNKSVANVTQCMTRYRNARAYYIGFPFEHQHDVRLQAVKDAMAALRRALVTQQEALEILYTVRYALRKA